MSDLKHCPFCGRNSLETVKIDFKDPGRDLIKCRHCRGQVSRFYWNERVISDDELNAALMARGLVGVPVNVVDGSSLDSAMAVVMDFCIYPSQENIQKAWSDLLAAAQEGEG